MYRIGEDSKPATSQKYPPWHGRWLLKAEPWSYMCSSIVWLSPPLSLCLPCPPQLDWSESPLLAAITPFYTAKRGPQEPLKFLCDLLLTSWGAWASPSLLEGLFQFEEQFHIRRRRAREEVLVLVCGIPWSPWRGLGNCSPLLFLFCWLDGNVIGFYSNLQFS